MNPFAEVIHVARNNEEIRCLSCICLSEESPDFVFFFFTTFKKKKIKITKENHKQCNIWIRVRNRERDRK